MEVDLFGMQAGFENVGALVVEAVALKFETILDEDGVSDDDCYCFYLLTAEAIFSGETKLAFHDVNSMTPERIHASLIDDEVMSLLCKKMMESYKNNMGVAVEILPNEVAPYINEIFEVIKG